MNEGRLYCARHDTWHDTTANCPHCATAALINELRQTIGTLEARLADADTQATQDRRRISALEHRALREQEAHNITAREALREELALATWLHPE